jgi:hypothetical protein
MSAHEWAKEHDACPDAIEWLAGHPGWTLADAWRECRRGDWMLWALEGAGYPIPWDVVDGIVDRAVREHALRCGIPEIERWARRWLSGDDRSDAAAAWAAWAAAHAAEAAASGAYAAAWADAAADAARAAESRRQADEIRAAVPLWPGGDA